MDKPKRNIWLRLAVAGLILYIMILYLFGGSGYFALRKMERHLDSLSVVRDSLNVQLEELQKRVELLKAGDLFAVEEAARSLEMARPGEEVIIIQIDTSSGNGDY